MKQLSVEIEGCFMSVKQRGFTLLELLVVMVIIGLLASIVGPRYFNQLGKSEVGTAEAQIHALSKALDMYRLDVGHYPPEEIGLNALNSNQNNNPKWRGPYLEGDMPIDPWDNPYVYRFPGEIKEYDLISFGRDGRPGGSQDDADIYN